jgi:murein DD-endopeptidase MepM/ murein hydrolase activator NlpD
MPLSRRAHTAQLIASLFLAGIAASWAASPSVHSPVFTALVVQPITAPRPFGGADGQTHLAYELSFVNGSHLFARVDSLAALDAATGAVLQEWKGDALAAILRLNAGKTGTTLGPGDSGYAFLDVALPTGVGVPRELRHRIAETRLAAVAGDAGRAEPLGADAPVPASATFTGATTQVDRRSVVLLRPPLAGPGWVVVNGCCAAITSHRGAVMAFDGVAMAPERFAIDFVQVDKDGRLFTGAVDRVADYADFGAPVYAVADAVVTEASDGLAEVVPGATPPGLPLDDYAGNHIVLDLGAGNFALYAHLKTGSVAVRPGQHVKVGEVIAHLGNTGNTTAPHLHFHVMDRPRPLAATGLPYEFASFIGEGRLVPDDAMFDRGEPAKIDRAWLPGQHRNQLPLDNEVIDFPSVPAQ